jgi:archaellum component FlaG (FlaF/FlaG flagellin family)
LKKSNLLNVKLVIFLTTVLPILSLIIFGSCINSGVIATPSDEAVTTTGSDEEFTSDLDALIEKVQNSPDECWKKPAQNRKDTICNKIDELQDLIDQGDFENAYDKLLHDIKPKLTGLKTDEHEEPWGNGVYNQPWVICPDLQLEFRDECNLILSEINPQAIYDDDKTPPIISIVYEGGNSVEDPGIWEVFVGDEQSGLDTVTILVDEGLWIEESLGGLKTQTYSVPVPAIEGVHTIEVTAVDNDHDRPNDQLPNTETHSVELITDDTAPGISITYVGSQDTNNPGKWIVLIEDPQSGIGIVLITVDGPKVLEEDLQGLNSKTYEISVPGIVGLHTIKVTATNNDSTPETNIEIMMIQINVPPISRPDNTAPIISISYEGTYTNYDPGIWKVHITDDESGIGEVQILVDGNIVVEENLQGLKLKIYDISVPGTIGSHTIEVTATNDDTTPDTNSKSMTVEIDDYN